MRLDHLLSKRKSRGCIAVWLLRVLCIDMRCKSFHIKCLVAMRQGETPIPIPNMTVKTLSADGTMLETAWESRRPPEQKRSVQPSEDGGEGHGVPTHLENRIYDNLAEHELQA